MRKIALLLPTILITLATTSCSNDAKTDLISENIKGNVKSIEQTTYKAVYIDSVATKTDTVLLMSIADFDTDGFKSSFCEFEGPNKTKTTYQFKYNDNGQRTESLAFNEAGTLIEKLVHSYDGIDNTQTDNFNANGDFMFRYTYPKDIEEGTLQTIIEDNKGNMSYKYMFTLDEKGNYVTMIVYHKNGDVYSNSVFEYQFDENNNWIKMTEIMDNKPRSITERKIIYYN